MCCSTLERLLACRFCKTWPRSKLFSSVEEKGDKLAEGISLLRYNQQNTRCIAYTRISAAWASRSFLFFKVQGANYYIMAVTGCVDVR